MKRLLNQWCWRVAAYETPGEIPDLLWPKDKPLQVVKDQVVRVLINASVYTLRPKRPYCEMYRKALAVEIVEMLKDKDLDLELMDKYRVISNLLHKLSKNEWQRLSSVSREYLVKSHYYDLLPSHPTDPHE